MALVESVPNVSEGRNTEHIALLASSIRSVADVSLLHIDTGMDANRTVFTLVGPPEAVLQALFNLYEKSLQLLDMSQHNGAHPRQGLVDVCPIIPISGISMNGCIDLAMRLSHRLAIELNIPGYLYEYNALHFERKNLAFLRKGEYESLPEKLLKLPPDFGPAENWKRSGITTLGARNLLVAYNVNLKAGSLKAAQKIARILRESGANGQPGKLKSVKAIGWYIKDFDCYQVSFNLCNLNETHLIEVYLAVKTEAFKLGIELNGSELVGLIPKSELLLAAAHFDNLANEEQAIQVAETELGLHAVKPFYPKLQILEYAVTEG